VLNLGGRTCAITSFTFWTTADAQRHRFPQVGLQPQLDRAGLVRAEARGPTEGLCRVRPQPVLDHAALTRAASEAGRSSLAPAVAGGWISDHAPDRRGLPSDNTDPFDRLSSRMGSPYAYTPGVMMAWVTDSPNWVNQRSTSLEYRFLSSMQGCARHRRRSLPLERDGLPNRQAADLRVQEHPHDRTSRASCTG